MPAEALDMALDDLVQSGGRGRGKGKGKGGFKGGFKSRFQGNKVENGFGAKSRGKGWKGKKPKDDDAKENKKENGGDDDAKLNMSLEEVIEKENKGSKGKGKRSKGQDWGNKDSEGTGKGKSRGKGKWGSDSYSGGYSGNGGGGWNGGGANYEKGGYKGSSKSKGYSKGYSKGWGKDKDDRGPPPSWNEHDDRDDDFGGKGMGRDSWDSGKGGRKGRSKGDDWERPRSTFGMGAAGRVREDRDGWQRVEQSAPIRDSWRDDPPARRRERDEPPRRREVGSDRLGPQKRRAAEPERAPPSKRRATEEDRNTKSVKVTNIPRDVTMQDIKEAFEQETGKITRCRLDRGTAWIAFTRPADARKAVDTFDRGELNGKQIGVVLDA